MNQSLKIILFGNERLSSGYKPNGAPLLQSLIDHGYKVVAVVASHHQATTRSERQLEVQTVAEQNNIPVLLPEKPADIIDDIKALGADIGVLAAYGKLIPQSVIEAFPHGIINIHPSLLPQYRGSTPIEQAILDGQKQTGVSLMQLVKAMDAGPVYDQQTVTLTGHETKQELTENLVRLGSEMLVKDLPAIIDGSLKPRPQDESQVTFSKLISKEQGMIDQSLPANILERQVRAYATWPKSRAQIFGQQVVVTKARVASSAGDGALVLPCANDSFLEVQQLIAPSGRSVNGADFLRGYKK